MRKKIRWGILGAGKIANKFAADLGLVADAELRAVASLDVDRAKQFSSKYNIPVTFNDYEKMASSGEVDVIYVATPHGFHYEHVMLCLRHRKAVLCEKAFALNLRQLSDMVALAKKQSVFLMEAFWTKFIPQFIEVQARIKKGEIGEIRWIQADFGFRAPEPVAQRLTDPALGGGSLLDIGIYPVFLAISLLGRPAEIKAIMTPYSTGVDEQCTICMHFESGAMAVLSSTLAVDTPTEAIIAGTAGRIHMRNRFHNPVGHLEMVRNKNENEAIEVIREEGYGYQFEARHVNECLQKGFTQSPVMSLDDSILLMETLDRIRLDCGIIYNADGDHMV